MIIDNKEYEISEKYNIKNYNKIRLDDSNDKEGNIPKINNLINSGNFRDLRPYTDRTDINGLFYNCSSLLSLPDISKWNTNKVTNMGDMFYGCPNIIFSKAIKEKFKLK